ncbi:unnamed protein product, partial [Ectocarpus sp. 4 AP-2014]
MSTVGSARGSDASPPPNSRSSSPRRGTSGSDIEEGALVGAPVPAASPVPSPVSGAPSVAAGYSSEAAGASGEDADGGELANAIVAASADAAASGLLLAGHVAEAAGPRASQGAAALAHQGPGYLDAPGSDAEGSGEVALASDVDAAQAGLREAQERLRRAQRKARPATPDESPVAGVPVAGVAGASAARRPTRAGAPAAGGRDVPLLAAGEPAARRPPTIEGFAAQQALEAAKAARKAATADLELRRRLEAAASARAAEAQQEVAAEKRKALAARRENADLVRAQSAACERRLVELRREQQALEILEAQGRQLVDDANIVRGERERTFRRAEERVRQRRADREAAELHVREVRGEGHATAVRAEAVLRDEGRSIRPVS